MALRDPRVIANCLPAAHALPACFVGLFALAFLALSSTSARSQCTPDPAVDGSTVTCAQGLDQNGFITNSNNVSVRVLSRAIVRGMGIRFIGGVNPVVANYGHIEGVLGVGVRMDGGTINNRLRGVITASFVALDIGSDTSVFNRGGIDGRYFGIVGVDGNTINNLGYIQAKTEAASIAIDVADGNLIFNSGRIEGVKFAIRLGKNNRVSNTGQIIALNGNAISTRDPSSPSNLTLFNGASGVIVAADGFYAVLGGASADKVTNHGLIDGAVALGRGKDQLINWGVINGAVNTSHGNDHITNRGTITGTVQLAWGNDVFVSNQGMVNGEVWLWDGDDRVVIYNGYGATGRYLGGKGFDKFVLGWRGRVNLLKPIQFEQIINRAGVAEIGDPGQVMSIWKGSDYIQLSRGRLIVDVNERASDRLILVPSKEYASVLGSATLAGDLTINAVGTGTFINRGYSVIIIEPTIGLGSVSGTFDTITDSNPNDFIGFDVRYTATRVNIFSRLINFTSAAISTNQQSAAGALDTLAASKPTGSLNTAIGTLQRSNRSDLPGTLDALYADTLGDRDNGGLASNTSFIDQVSGLAFGLQALGLQPGFVSFNGVDGSLRGSALMVRDQYGLTSHGAGRAPAGTTLGLTRGGVLAASHYVTRDGFAFGLAMGGGDMAATFRSRELQNDTGVNMAFYGLKQQGNITWFGIASVGYRGDDLEYSMFHEGPNDRPNGDRETFTGSASFGARASYEWGALSFSPQASLNVASVDHRDDAFDDQPSFALNYQDTQDVSVRASLGFNLSGAFGSRMAGWQLVPTLGVHYDLELADTDRTIRAAFAGHQDIAFTLYGDALNRHAARLTLGMDSLIGDTIRLGLAVESILGNAEQRHQATLRATLSW